MERAASLGHSITESMFVYLCVSFCACACERENVPAQMQCFHLSARRYSKVRSRSLIEEGVHARGHRGKRTGRREERRPGF